VPMSAHSGPPFPKEFPPSTPLFFGFFKQNQPLLFSFPPYAGHPQPISPHFRSLLRKLQRNGLTRGIFFMTHQSRTPGCGSLFSYEWTHEAPSTMLEHSFGSFPLPCLCRRRYSRAFVATGFELFFFFSNLPIPRRL